MLIYHSILLGSPLAGLTPDACYLLPAWQAGAQRCLPAAGVLRPYAGFAWEQIAIDEGIALDDFAGANRNGIAEDRTIENEGVELAVFAAGVDVGRQIAEEGSVELATGEAGVENFEINAGGEGAGAGRVKLAD